MTPPSKLKVFEVVECGGAGGTGNQVAAICNGLDKNRFDVTLVYSVRPGSGPKEYEALARGASRFVYIPEMVREISPGPDSKAWRRLRRLFKENKPDIVHGHSSKAGFLARTAALAAGVPNIFYSPRGYSFLQTDRPLTSRWFYRLLERAVAGIGTTVAVSGSEAELARRSAGAKRVRVIRDAYLGAMPQPSGSTRDKARNRAAVVICAAGRLTHARHPEAFVRLAMRLADSRNDVKCVWVGSGELEPSIREMARDLNLADKLEITGWLPRDQAMERLKSADIFVHFSRWEGLPNSVLEAMALGLPVVASDIPGNSDLVRDGETGFLAPTEVDLLERTLELMGKPELREKFGRNVRMLVEKEYSESRMLREYAELYSSCPPASKP